MPEELDTRKAAILKAIVQEYVMTGQPVGSRTIVDRYSLKVSAATIRNDMAFLEELGYIAQPHTSAGRIPTDVGYRWFVDTWPAPPWPPPTDAQKRAIVGFGRTGFRGIDETFEGTSHVLSEITEAASVVVPPPSRTNKLRRMELLMRDPRRATLLLIADTGEVKQGIVEFGRDQTEASLSALQTALNAELEGAAFEDLVWKVRQRKGAGRQAKAASLLDDDRSRIAEEMEKIITPSTVDRIFRGGTAHILDPGNFADMSVAQEVVAALESADVLSGLVDAARKTNSILVYIGKEIPIEQMRSCAVIFAPFQVEEGRLGTLGIIAPMRIDYPQTISAVGEVARSVSRLIDLG